MHRLPTLALVTLAVLAVAPNAHASAPAGVWARVDKVTLEQDPKDPQLIRVDGIFMVAHTLPDAPDYPGYSVPSAGYMYYDCSDKQQAICVMEWLELAAIAGTDDRCRGWGDSSLPDNGSVRAAMAPMEKPDLYPIAQGVVTGFTPCEVLKAWEVEHGSTGGETETSTSTSDTGTSTTDTSTTDRPEPGSTGAPDPGSTADSGEVTTTVTGSDSAAESKGETGDIVGESSSGPGGTSSGGSGSSGGAPGDTAASDDDKACACRSDADPGGQALGVLASLAGLGLLGGRRRRA